MSTHLSPAGTVAILASTGPRERRVAASDLTTDFAGNTGNTIFDDALHALLPHADHLQEASPPALADYEHVVLSLANIIAPEGPSAALAQLTDGLAEARRLNPSLRYVVTAVGGQYHSIGGPAPIHPDRLALIRQLAESAEFLGVRGHFTAEVLADHGITNTWVVGDPGLLHPRIGAEPGAARADGGLVVHWTPSGRYRDIYREFLDWSRRHGADLVVQSAGERLLPGPAPHSVVAGPDLATILRYYCWPDAPHEGLEPWMVERGRWFGAPDDWYGFLRGARLAIGARIHGNAAAAIAGVPALQLTLDSRTAELSAFHGLPSMPLQRFDARRSPEEYLELADPGTLHARLPALRANLRAYWAAVGIDGGGLDGAGGDVVAMGALDAPGAVAPGESAWRRGLGLQDRYLRRAIAHANALDTDPLLPETRDRSVLEAIALPRSDEYGQLVDLGPSIAHAVRVTTPDRAAVVRRLLGTGD